MPIHLYKGGTVSNQAIPLWECETQFDLSGPLRGLKHNNAQIRRHAAATLAALNATRAVPELQAALGAEQDEAVQSALQAALRALNAESDSTPAANTDEQARRLIKQLESSTSEAVIEAAQRLGELRNKLAVEPLVFLFRNAKVSIQVRLAVAEALLKLESAPVEVTLLATLRHNDWHIRRNGAAILGQLRAEWAIEPLTRALEDPHRMVRRTARAALRHIGTPEARRALAQAEENRNVSPVRSVTAHNDSADDGLKPLKGGILRHVQVPIVPGEATSDAHEAEQDQEDALTVDSMALQTSLEATIPVRPMDTSPLHDDDEMSAEANGRIPTKPLGSDDAPHSAPTQPLPKSNTEAPQTDTPNEDS